MTRQTVEEFLSQGGKIKEVPQGEVTIKENLHRSREDILNYYREKNHRKPVKKGRS